MQIVGRPKVGALPVHGYDVPQLGQFWSHSDIDGSFFVISVDAINATAAEVAVRALATCNKSCQEQFLHTVCWQTIVFNQSCAGSTELSPSAGFHCNFSSRPACVCGGLCVFLASCKDGSTHDDSTAGKCRTTRPRLAMESCCWTTACTLKPTPPTSTSRSVITLPPSSTAFLPWPNFLWLENFGHRAA